MGEHGVLGWSIRVGECGVPLKKKSKKEKYDRSTRDDSCVSNKHGVPLDVNKRSVRLLVSARR